MSVTRQEHLDHCLTRLQERGYCRVATLSVAEIMAVVELAGLYADECFIDVAGWLYVKGSRVAAGVSGAD